jgi:hypothetical protein
MISANHWNQHKIYFYYLFVWIFTYINFFIVSFYRFSKIKNIMFIFSKYSERYRMLI